MTSDNSDNHILTEIADGILRITINRPQKKNALTIAMYAEMADAVNRSNTDSSVRVVFIQGTGDCFTAGNDLQDFKDYTPDGSERPLNPFLVAISVAEKPLVAAVSGIAIGVGTTMLLHCDLVFAGENARFRLPFVNLGLCPEAASSLLLPRLVGHQQASELLLLGEMFSADKAREIGLVNTVYPDDQVVEKALEYAGQIAAKPPASVRLTKALLKGSLKEYVAGTMAKESKYFAERLGSPECDEALAAFFERRDPDFSSFK